MASNDVVLSSIATSGSATLVADWSGASAMGQPLNLYDADGAGSVIDGLTGDGASAVNIDATSVSLSGGSGVGDSTSGEDAIDISASEISLANSSTNDILVDNFAATVAVAETVVTSAVHAGVGRIAINQIGGKGIDLRSVSTADGAVQVTNSAGTMTARSVLVGGSDTDDNVELTTTGTGSIVLGTVTASGNVVTISAADAIADIDTSDDSTANVEGQAAILMATSGIGDAASNADLDTAVSQLDVANVTAGGIFITNAGALELTDLDSDGANLAVSGAASDGFIVATSPLTISANAITTGGMTYTASDSAVDDVDHLVVTGVGTLVQDDTALTLSAGDDLVVDVGATVELLSSTSTLKLNIDAGNADAGGESAVINGALVTGGMEIVITGGTESDTYVFDDNAGLIDDGGTASGIGADLTIVGGGGADRVSIDDSGDTSADSVVIAPTGVDSGTIAGLVDSGTTITYSGFDSGASVTLQLGSGADLVDLTPQANLLVEVDGNLPAGGVGDHLLYRSNGTDAFAFGSDRINTDGLADIGFTDFETFEVVGDVLIAGSGEDDQLTVSANSESTGTFQLVRDATGVGADIGVEVAFNSGTLIQRESYSMDGPATM